MHDQPRPRWHSDLVLVVRSHAVFCGSTMEQSIAPILAVHMLDRAEEYDPCIDRVAGIDPSMIHGMCSRFQLGFQYDQK